MDLDSDFVVTPWRSSEELLQVRCDFYSRGESDRREKAINKVLAWRSRKPDLPLLLDSTADIVDVVLQDERGLLAHNALRLLYATAISRFITGLADTQIELTRDRPSWFPPGKSLQLPTSLLEIRHRIVHRHLPSLAELKRAAATSLDWLWEWYWAQLDHAFSLTKPSGQEQEGVSDMLMGILKAYVKKRKTEIKTRRKDGEASKAAENALSNYTLRFAPSSTSHSPAHTQTLLVELLVGEKMVLPADKKYGSSMSGAFLVWTPLLLTFCSHFPPLRQLLLTHMMDAMNASAGTHVEVDPVREGMYEWISHMLCSEEWKVARPTDQIREDILMRCFSDPTFWNLKLAGRILQDETVAGREMWIAVLAAAGGEEIVVSESREKARVDVDVDDMDVENTETGLPVEEDREEKKEVKEKIKGPQKVVGLWKPRAIGTLPEGWEEE
ncbi:Las1-domain-containing protein [Dothidotthia symphoricarpi CBS 119687]|uniref:Las1-domain-containing protein n=1 Tax=Dothidotthia symphoricarpi CBS 119687 TaxID=1392245 RepID=A0A6A6A6X7_9PLEO|nr:Las1-domain-containing protein [Dothidotthia symphoricarpi CBS 119687]KAF2126538.1 Las1-domain-containing protein [Dothidotthia symphoricarpi CBS 119687]